MTRLTDPIDIDFVLRATGLGRWEIDFRTGQIAWDDRCRELLGLARGNDLPYQQITHHIHPADVEQVTRAARWAMNPRSAGIFQETYRIIGADDGQLRWVRCSGKRYVSPTGNTDRLAGVAQEVTEAELNRYRSRESENRFRSLIAQAPVATGLFVGPDFIVQEANQPMRQLWGKGNDVLGRPLVAVLPELVEQPFMKILAQVYATGNPYQAFADRCELVIAGRPQTFYFNFTYQPILDDQGQVYAIMDMAIDVTAQVLAQQQLEQSLLDQQALSGELEERVHQRTQELASSNEELTAVNEELLANNEQYAALNEDLEEANRLLMRSNDNLQKFAYVASHDLQEPLRKIQQFGDLLRNQYGPHLGDGIDFLERMQSAARRMSTLIRDLLSFSRIATQRDTSAPVSLNQVIDTVLVTLELVMAETGAQVAVAPLPIVLGDGPQLGQLFQNLLSNALKFRREGIPPVVRVSGQRLLATDLPPAMKLARASRYYYRVDVTDNGIGFEEKYLDRIFAVFQRLHGKDQYAGTGIGLAICEKVVTNHGGAITATSQPGQGATFSLYLPA